MAIVNGYDAYVINPDILSEYNVDQSGEVVSAEVWKALWDLVLGALIKYDRAFIDIYRTLTDLNTELDNCIQRVDRIEEIYDALAERMETLEKTWTELQATYNKIAGHYEDIKDIHDALKEGLVHYGVDAPTLKYTKLWVVPTQFPLSPLHDIVNDIITSRTDSELDENSENPVQNKVIVENLDKLKADLDKLKADPEKGTIKVMTEQVNLWELETGVYYLDGGWSYTKHLGSSRNDRHIFIIYKTGVNAVRYIHFCGDNHYDVWSRIACGFTNGDKYTEYYVIDASQVTNDPNNDAFGTKILNSAGVKNYVKEQLGVIDNGLY